MTLGQRFGAFVERVKESTLVGRSISAVIAPRFGYGLNTELSFEEAVKQYKSLVWVYRCVSAYSSAISSVPWKVFNAKGTEESHVPGHPLERLLNTPNSFFGRREFFDTWTAHLFLSGRAYWEKVSVGKDVRELWNIRPDYMKPIPNQNTFISNYEFRPPSAIKAIPFAVQDIVEFKFIDPLDAYGCLSPLAAASRAMATENSAIGWNRSMLDNSGIPGGIYKIPVTSTTKAQRDELKAAIKEAYGGKNKFETMILWGGMDWTRMGFSPTDMQFLEQRRLNKYEICSVFGVPPQMVGAQEDPTYSNYAVARLSFWEDSVIPLLAWIESKVNAQITPSFGPNLIARYDLTRVPAMREAFTQQINNGFKLWQMGWPINAINRRLGLGMTAVPWGDSAYVQINMTPIDKLGENLVIDTTPAEPDDTQLDDDQGDSDPNKTLITSAVRRKLNAQPATGLEN